MPSNRGKGANTPVKGGGATSGKGPIQILRRSGPQDGSRANSNDSPRTSESEQPSSTRNEKRTPYGAPPAPLFGSVPVPTYPVIHNNQSQPEFYYPPFVAAYPGSFAAHPQYTPNFYVPPIPMYPPQSDNRQAMHNKVYYNRQQPHFYQGAPMQNQQYPHYQRQQYTPQLSCHSTPLEKFNVHFVRIIKGSIKLGALVKTEYEIDSATEELKMDLKKYDPHGASVPISECSLSYLAEREIEPLRVPPPSFGWAAYYCTLCDYHLKDVFHIVEHLPQHVKEEKRMQERRTLSERLPSMSSAQLTAVDRVIRRSLRPHNQERVDKLMSIAEAAMVSLREVCSAAQSHPEPSCIKIGVFGSLVSGLVNEDSNMNLSLSVDKETIKFFVDEVINTLKNASDWSDVRIAPESPISSCGLEGLFRGERVIVDWQNDDAIRLSQLLAIYNKLNPSLLELRQIVIEWAKKCDLITPSKLHSQHAVPRVLLDIMLIHSLQQNGRLPCVHEIRKNNERQLLDENVDDILDSMTPLMKNEWQLAECFLDFLVYFAKGDIRLFVVQIRSLDKPPKGETKYNRKHLIVLDPIRERVICSLHKAFQCYFFNCFLTSFVHYRVPRAPYALLDVRVYQLANQSPLKKKNQKKNDSTKKSDGNEEDETMGEDVTQEDVEDEESVEGLTHLSTPAPPSPSSFLGSLLNSTIPSNSAPSDLITLLIFTSCRSLSFDDFVQRKMKERRADCLIGLYHTPTHSKPLPLSYTGRYMIVRSTVEDNACVVAMREASATPPQYHTPEDETMVQVCARTLDICLVGGMTRMGGEDADAFTDLLKKKMSIEKSCVFVGRIDDDVINDELVEGKDVLRLKGPSGEPIVLISRGITVDVHSIQRMQQGLMLTMHREDTVDEEEKSVVCKTLHGRPMSELQPEDYELDGEGEYSRMTMYKIRDEVECSIDKDIFTQCYDFGITMEEEIVGQSVCEDGSYVSITPIKISTEPSNSSTSKSSKKKRMRKKKKKEGTKVDGNDDDGEMIEGVSQEDEEDNSFKPKECVVAAINCVTLVSHDVQEEEQPVSSRKKPRARRALNLKRNESSLIDDVREPQGAESIKDVETTVEEKDVKKNEEEKQSLEPELDMANIISNAVDIEAQCSTSQSIMEPMKDGEEQIRDNLDQLSISSPAMKKEEKKKKKNKKNESENVVYCVQHMKTSEVTSEEKKEEEEEETVLPAVDDSKTDTLLPTYEELYIDINEYDIAKIRKKLGKLCADDFIYSFEPIELTAGFRCDLHCTACDSTKHLMDKCPQLAIPKVVPISRTHWPKYYSDEIDTMIIQTYEQQRIQASRQKAFDDALKTIEQALETRFEKGTFKIDIFGSIKNGFGSNQSDFDLCFRFTDAYASDGDVRSSTKEIETIKLIARALSNHRSPFSHVQPITGAKVPIVKFIYRNQLEGDISYYNELALFNTDLLSTYCSWTKDNKLSQLGLFVKQWAKQCDIGDASKGSLSSYAYIILLIHFLQKIQVPVLPVLQETGEKHELLINGWDVYFDASKPQLDWSGNTDSVGELFLQFLDFYAKYDWGSKVVQIRQTRTLTKLEKGWTKKRICIEDPFDLDHNLGSGISNRMFAFIAKSFVASREVFFRLKERQSYCDAKVLNKDERLPDDHVLPYAKQLLRKCKVSGGAPRDRLCFKCGKVGHFSDGCPAPQFNNRGPRSDGGYNVPNSPRSGGNNHGGGGSDRKMDRREVKKERLALQRAARNEVKKQSSV